jgi:copper homeostasis protein CutC
MSSEQMTRGIELIAAANGSVGIMAASGIEEHNIAELVQRTGVREVHASLRSAVASSTRYQNEQVSMGATRGREYQRFVADQQKVRKLLGRLLLVIGDNFRDEADGCDAGDRRKRRRRRDSRKSSWMW